MASFSTSTFRGQGEASKFEIHIFIENTATWIVGASVVLSPSVLLISRGNYRVSQLSISIGGTVSRLNHLGEYPTNFDYVRAEWDQANFEPIREKNH